MFDAVDERDYGTYAKPVNTADQTYAREFTDQVDAFYSLPRPQYNRTEIVFSPSGVTKCARELYYMHTGAPVDTLPTIPWRERLARNGTGVHNVTEADYAVMEERLRVAGKNVRFRLLASELKGEREYQFDGVTVKLRGRCDGQLGVLDDDGNVIETLLFEKKTRDKRKNLNKVIKAGSPTDEHRAQATAYALIWGIQKCMFEYESLAKPEWKEVVPDKPDIFHVMVQIERDEAKALLKRLSGVVKSIQSRELPAPELEKCGFCPFKTQCHSDGGYGN